jgi:hypothetical protein
MNAMSELLKDMDKHGKKISDIKWIVIAYTKGFTNKKILIDSKEGAISMNDLMSLDFDYDAGYGGQEIFGYVVFKDNTWLSRGEYDGSEWWEYRKPPKMPEELEE